MNKEEIAKLIEAYQQQEKDGVATDPTLLRKIKEMLGSVAQR